MPTGVSAIWPPRASTSYYSTAPNASTIAQGRSAGSWSHFGEHGFALLQGFLTSLKGQQPTQDRNGRNAN
jgi:hypothetical protein